MRYPTDSYEKAINKVKEMIDNGEVIARLHIYKKRGVEVWVVDYMVYDEEFVKKFVKKG